MIRLHLRQTLDRRFAVPSYIAEGCGRVPISINKQYVQKQNTLSNRPGPYITAMIGGVLRALEIKLFATNSTLLSNLIHSFSSRNDSQGIDNMLCTPELNDSSKNIAISSSLSKYSAGSKFLRSFTLIMIFPLPIVLLFLCLLIGYFLFPLTPLKLRILGKA